MIPLSEIQHEARQRGLDWSDVEAAYRKLKALEWEKRQRPNEIRQSAWIMYTASVPGCWPFWRHGFLARWGRKLAEGRDYSCIRGYDEIGQEIASEYPEYATDDGTERLWEFLLSPYDRLPVREDLYRRAMEIVESTPAPEPVEIPF